MLHASNRHIPQTRGCQQLEVALFDIPFTAGQQESGGLVAPFEVTSAFRQQPVKKKKKTTDNDHSNLEIYLVSELLCNRLHHSFRICFSSVVRESVASLN